MAVKNSTFCGAEPTWANACVGDNGNPGYEEYSRGFSTAANVLIDQVLAGQGLGLSTDELVYPVCFNMRHSVELRLKGSIEVLIKIAAMKGKKLSFNLSGSHDIGNIWAFFRAESELLDARYVDLNESINCTLQDIAGVDATGQTFRYPLSNESQKHLIDVSLINFVRLKRVFGELEKNLDKLHDLNLWLEDEYAQGTFTSKFTRPMLYKLAFSLPAQHSWSGVEFSEIKKSLINEFSVTSNDLSRAISKVKGQYYLASVIGDPLPVKGLSQDALFLFLDHWCVEVKEEEKCDPFNNIDGFIAGIKSRGSRRESVWSEFKDIIRPELLAGFNALYYFSINKTFVEYYDRLYSSELKESIFYFEQGDDGVRQSFFHIFEKTNAMSCLLMSLFALGHSRLAERAVEKYGVDPTLHWLDKARSGELFAFPEYAKY